MPDYVAGSFRINPPWAGGKDKTEGVGAQPDRKVGVIEICYAADFDFNHIVVISPIEEIFISESRSQKKKLDNKIHEPGIAPAVIPAKAGIQEILL